MNRKVIRRILNTIDTYLGIEYDGVYINRQILDLLVEDLAAAIRCEDIDCLNCCKDECEDAESITGDEDDELLY